MVIQQKRNVLMNYQYYLTNKIVVFISESKDTSFCLCVTLITYLRHMEYFVEMRLNSSNKLALLALMKIARIIRNFITNVCVNTCWVVAVISNVQRWHKIRKTALSYLINFMRHALCLYFNVCCIL